MNTSDLRDALRRDAELVGEPPGDLLDRIRGLRRRSHRRRAGVAAAAAGVALLAVAVPVGGALLDRADGGNAVVPADTLSGPSVIPLELTAGNACGEAFFWASTASGDVAVTVSVDVRDRSSVEATTREFEIPDATVTVEILEGRDLSRNFCTDVYDSSVVQGRQEAVAGAGTITLDPAPADQGPGSSACGTVSGRLRLTGLVAEDGTTFAPIQVTGDEIDCIYG